MPDALDRLARAATALERDGAAALVRRGGTVHEVATDICRVRGLSAIAALGDCVALETAEGPLPGQVVHLSADEALVKPFSSEVAIRLGMRVWHEGPFRLRPHAGWKGRTINALGEAMDGGPPPEPGERAMAVDRPAPPALQRQRTGAALKTGVRAVDLFTPVCFGQRLGVFAGSGVGKTTFLSMLARSSGFDTVVLALIGERGREVREFMEDVLPPEQRARTVSVVATGDESPMMRRLALKSAITVAEYFRDAGEEVRHLLRPAPAAGAHRAGAGGRGQHHRLPLGAGGRRRSQRPGGGQHPRHPRRAHRAGARDRRAGALPGHQRAFFRFAAGAAGVDEGAGGADPDAQGADHAL